MAEIINSPVVRDTSAMFVNDDSARVDNDDPKTKKPKFDLPAGFDDEAGFLRYAVQTYNDDVTADFLNTQAMVDDARFVIGKQWDIDTERRRLNAKKPVMTINRLPAYVAQIMGNRLLNETVIKVIPDEGGTKEKARVRQGLIRSIEKHSRADLAYDTALQNSLVGGLGNFALDHQYAKYDVFYQDLKITRIPDPIAVVWDHLSIEPSGRDATHVYVEERMSRKAFRNAYPWASMGEFGGDTTYLAQLTATGWYTVDTVRVVKFYRLLHEERTVILRNDTGKVVDVTGQDPKEYAQFVAVHPETGERYERTALRPYVEIYKLSATDILEGPSRLNCSRVPVFRVPGWEVFIGDERHRWGMIRFAKDPQRIHNYWRSVIVEKLMQTPRAKWKATKEAVQGFESKWRNSHLTDDPLLLWNGDSGQEPQEVQPAQIEPALIQEANMATQDIKDVLNMHEAALGQQSNEVSGKALNARQRVSELGSVIYFSNLNGAIEECGRTINELIPDFYDTARIIRLIGEDGKASLQAINQAGGIDICDGHYGITVTTGPSYTTRRVEAVESMLSLQNANPEAMAPALDIMVEEMDWPGAERISKRLKKANPIAAAEIDPSEMSPEEQQQFQMAQQKAAMAEQIGLKMQELQMAELAHKIAELKARTVQLEAQTKATNAQAVKTIVDAEKSLAETAKIEAETAQVGVQPAEDPLMAGNVEAQQIANEGARIANRTAEVQQHINIAQTLHELNPVDEAEFTLNGGREDGMDVRPPMPETPTEE